ncbi:MAG: dioxygenase [Alphaproteobacteria bacterium]|nr:dioxygenase [Alphaproteobacteria bacterium]
MSFDRLPTYFLSHGGGPWPWLPERHTVYKELEASLLRVRDEIGEKPRAILMVSGHWEEADGFGVMSAAKPPMFYDYRGFPEHTYSVQYPSPGAPDLAEDIRALLASKHHTTWLDGERGYDHGVFTIAVCMYPDADVPILQVSIRSDYDVQTHLQLGRDLAPLRQQGVVIIGSGLSYHNLRNIRNPDVARAESAEFDTWLHDTLTERDPDRRIAGVLKWDQAPSARKAHPEEDHLVPMMVALGAAENEPATRLYHQDDFFGATSVSSYRFG